MAKLHCVSTPVVQCCSIRISFFCNIACNKCLRVSTICNTSCDSVTQISVFSQSNLTLTFKFLNICFLGGLLGFHGFLFLFFCFFNLGHPLYVSRNPSQVGTSCTNLLVLTGIFCDQFSLDSVKRTHLHRGYQASNPNTLIKMWPFSSPCKRISTRTATACLTIPLWLRDVNMIAWHW